MTDKKQYDWKGDAIGNEKDDDIINIWEIEPHPDSRHDVLWVRDYYEMIRLMTDEIPYMIDQVEEDMLLKEPFKVSFRLRKITVKEWNKFLQEELEQEEL